MNKDDLIRLSKNPDFIPGIYNYCDRWCERCAFTKQCMNYAMGEEMSREGQTDDIDKEEYWDGIHKMFELTMEMLEEAAKEHGVNLEEIMDEDGDYEKEESERRERVEQHPLSVASKKYFNLVDDWMKESQTTFEEKSQELSQQAMMGLDEKKIEETMQRMDDAVQVIRWYQYFIHVKFMRGISSVDDGDDEDDHPKDSDGSVKIALIAIDRSIAAWGMLYEMFPEKADDILTILAHLDALRKAGEKQFPHARAFIRPGFDEGSMTKS